MKETSVEQFAKDVNGHLKEAQKERLVITRNGNPVAMVVGMENRDAEDFHYMTSPDFWRMIRESRQMPAVPLRDVEAELFADDRS